MFLHCFFLSSQLNLGYGNILILTVDMKKLPPEEQGTCPGLPEKQEQNQIQTSSGFMISCMNYASETEFPFL